MHSRIGLVLLVSICSLTLLPGAANDRAFHICGPDVIKLKKDETKTYTIFAGGFDTYYEVQSQSNPEKVLVEPDFILISHDGVFEVTGNEPGTNTILIYWDSTRYDEELADGVCQVKVRVASPDINSTGDADDIAPGDGMCDTDGLIDRNGNEEMECTLRAAITESNAVAGSDSYMYKIPSTDPGAAGDGKFRITPAPLPTVSSPLNLNGETNLGKGGAVTSVPTTSIEIRGAGMVYGPGSNGSVLTGHTILASPGAGVEINANFVQIRNSYIGTNSDNALLEGNATSGVLINGNDNTIGGPGEADRNIIGGNIDYGVEIHGTGNNVLGNWIGIGSDGQTAVSNGMGGVAVLDGNSNRIGGSTNIPGRAPGNVITATRGDPDTGGVLLASNLNNVRGNVIGLTDMGDVPTVGQNYNGVLIKDGASDNIVGGTADVTPDGPCAGVCNLISGNSAAGVRIAGASTSRNYVVGNYIGLEKNGGCILENDRCPVGNRTGVEIADDATNNTIGGADANQRNVISGNWESGIRIDSHENAVLGNFIGTHASGLSAVPNEENGVLIEGNANKIGGVEGLTEDGPCTGACNLISGNLEAGIRLEGAGSMENLIKGNYIGTALNGTDDVGNGEDGILVNDGATKNVIGGDDVEMANLISHNDSTGVVVAGESSIENTIRKNRIIDNGLLAIDLDGDGVTANDLGDGLRANADKDNGPNSLMNFPVAITVSRHPEQEFYTLTGLLDVPNPENAVIDIYSSEMAAKKKSGTTHMGQGQKYEVTITPDASGIFTYTKSGTLGLGDFEYPILSATATDENGSTSEFSWVCFDTDSNGSADNDEDGLCDDWESTGIDYDGDGTVDLNLKTVDASLSADVNKKDIFVEIDYMGGHSEKPLPNAISDVKTAFSNKNVNLHLLEDEALTHVNLITFAIETAGTQNDFKDFKLGNPIKPCGTGANDGHFGTAADRSNAMTCAAKLGARRLAFRYTIFAHSYDDGDGAGSSGKAELPGNDFLVSIGSWNLNLAEKLMAQAGTIMHEMGHTLNLRHGGIDHVQWKPNYPSIMSYMLQFTWVVTNRILDYSREQLPTLDESDLDESAGLGGSVSRPVVYNQNFSLTAGIFGETKNTVTTANQVDWNGNGTTEMSTKVDLNYHGLRDDGSPRSWPAGFQQLRGHDDWSNILYNFRLTSDFEEGTTPVPEPDATPEMTEEFVRELSETIDLDGDGLMNAEDNCGHIANPDQEDLDGDGVGDVCQMGASDIGVLIDVTPSPALIGQPLSMTMNVENYGPDAAENVTLVDTLDASLQIDSIVPEQGSCSFEDAIIICRIGSLDAGEKRSVDVMATLTEDRTLNNRYSVTSGSLDPDPTNNVVYLSIAVPGTVDNERHDDPDDERGQQPFEFQLHQNYPNPFSNTTTIRYDVAEASYVRIEVVDLLGRTVRTLVDARRSPGSYAVALDGRDMPAGTYFYRIEAGEQRETKRMVLVR